MINIKSKVKHLVETDKLDEALNELSKYSHEINLLHKDQISLLKGNLIDIKKRSLSRTISIEDEVLYLNRIRLSIIQILDSIDKLRIDSIEDVVTINNPQHFDNEAKVKSNPLYTYNPVIKIINAITLIIRKVTPSVEFIFICFLVGVLVIVPYFLYRYETVKTIVNSKVEVLLDKNELDKAQALIDSVVTVNSSFQKSDFQWKILSKKIEQELSKKNIENANKILLSSNKYFDFRKENIVSVHNVDTYNTNADWYNRSLLDIALNMESKSDAIMLIENQTKPNFFLREGNLESNYNKKIEMIEVIKKSLTNK